MPTCGIARLDFLVSVLDSPCPGCPSSFGSAVSPARLRSQNLRLNSLFPQRVNSFTLDHVKKLKNHPIVGNTGHLDNEIDLPDSDGLFRHRPCPGTCSLYGCWSQRDRASFRPSAQFGLRRSLRPFLMSCFLTEQVLTQLDLLRYRKETATYKNELYFLQNQLDEKM